MAALQPEISPEDKERVDFILSTYPDDVNHTLQHPSKEVMDAYYVWLKRKESELSYFKREFQKYERHVRLNWLDFPPDEREEKSKQQRRPPNQMPTDPPELSKEDLDRITFLFNSRDDDTLQHPSQEEMDGFWFYMTQVELRIKNKLDKLKRYNEFVKVNFLDLPLVERIPKLRQPRSWFQTRAASVQPEGGRRRRRRTKAAKRG